MCDGANSDLKVFTLDGKIVNRITSYDTGYVLQYPCSVTLSRNGDSLVSADSAKDLILILR